MCICKKKDTNLFGLPHLQHRHASNYGVGIFLCCRIYCVIGSNNKCQVCLCGPDIYTKQIITKTARKMHSNCSECCYWALLTPHFFPSDINRTMCPTLQAWSL